MYMPMMTMAVMNSNLPLIPGPPSGIGAPSLCNMKVRSTWSFVLCVCMMEDDYDMKDHLRAHGDSAVFEHWRNIVREMKKETDSYAPSLSC
ncbi:hypothetical protein PRECH8_09730 [Insulibacter thermoxylanivorax]|uniref:Uncharacterized protein n=1 Tax=Insulibacter thermoxylanivorax TaxID=2749268 RepID=A0A916QFW7_9BACL|nr:hypothetical protein PRECH8_09730 [Insulibacter thermoxylanivorax]